MIVVSVLVISNRDGFKADEELKLTSLLKERPTGFDACLPQEEASCLPYNDRVKLTKRVNGHLRSMLQDAARGCVSDPKSLNIIIPEKGVAVSSDYWNCSIDSVTKSATSRGLDQYRAEVTASLNSLPSSDKKIIFLDNIPIQGANQATRSGGQKFELAGTVTGKLVVTITVTAGNPNVRIDWQRPKLGEEPKTVMSGEVTAKIAYQFKSDTVVYGTTLHDGPGLFGDEPGFIAEKSPQHTTVDTESSLSIGWTINDLLDPKGTLIGTDQITQLSICQPRCHEEIVKDDTWYHEYKGPDTIIDPNGDSKADPTLYGTTEERDNNIQTKTAEGIGDTQTGRLFYSSHTTNFKPNTGSSGAKAEGHLKRTANKGATNENITDAWNYLGTIDKVADRDLMRNDKTETATLNEKLDYQSQDKIYNPQRPGQAVNDNGSVVINNLKVMRHNGEFQTLSGSAGRTNPLIQIASKPACPISSAAGSEGSSSQELLPESVRKFRASAPLSEALGCFDPFAELQPLILRSLDKYNRPSRVSEPNTSIRGLFSSHLATRERVLPNFITVLFTDPVRTPTQVAQKQAVLDLLHSQARSKGAAVTVLEPKRQSYKSGDIGNVLIGKDGNNEDILRRDSWLVVIGKNPADYHASDGILPAWKVNTILEAKSVKMSVYAPGSCSGYSNIAESFLPLLSPELTDTDQDEAGIETNNFEYLADDIGQGLEKMMGCS